MSKARKRAILDVVEQRKGGLIEMAQRVPRPCDTHADLALLMDGVYERSSQGAVQGAA